MLSNHSAGHLAILFQLLGKYFFVIGSVSPVRIIMFVKVYVLEGGVIPLLCHGVSTICRFHVILCHKAKVSAVSCVTAVILVCHDCEWVSFLIKVLVRALAACIIRGFFLYLGGFLLWCCQFGVVIIAPMACNSCNNKKVSYNGEYAYKLLHFAMYGYCSVSG